ncbi:uncharacterized protein [Ptychodera flava]|uniref:uncharacterized protein isoform X1 n=1 Tax=Ptychodera flava TaxID=63121 RepID=UPI00396A3B6E
MMLNSSSTTELNSQTLSQNGGHQISAGNGDISSHANGSIALGISATQCGERELMVPNPTNTVTPLSQSQNEEEGHEMKARNGDIPSRANGHCNGEVRVISTQSRAPQHKRKSDRGDAAGPRCMSEENESKLRELKPKLAEDMPYQQVLDRMSTVFTREDEAEIKKEIHSDFDKRRKLIDILIMKDNSAFGKFVRVLEKVSPHLAKSP